MHLNGSVELYTPDVLMQHFSMVLELLYDSGLVDRPVLMKWFTAPLRDFDAVALDTLMLRSVTARQLKRRMAQPFLNFIEFQEDEDEEQDEAEEEDVDGHKEGDVMVVEEQQ